MKVLFISQGGQTQDYLRDCAAHGFRTLLGPEFVDVNRLDSLYVGADRTKMYGRGYTLYGLLPDEPIDRSDIPKKIRTKYFDLIVYGSIHRNQDYLHEVMSMYPSDRIVLLDGEDHPGHLSGIPATTFKRELHRPVPGVHPIQFSIPEEKILTSRPIKKRLMAPCDPLDRSTYIYTDEASYYQQYADSYYGATMMKAGWDCLRHYEIMSQWCLPYFRALDACPPSIMTKLPKSELRLIQAAIDSSYSGCYDMLTGIYDALINPVMNVLRKELTTTAMAKYILDTMKCS